jgi:hypothetical protein
MRFQYRMGSALLGGVGEDAAHVVERIAGYVRANHRAGARDPAVSARAVNPSRSESAAST